MGEVRSLNMPLTDQGAETAILGAMLASDEHPLDCRDEVVETFQDVGASVFHNPDYRKIYQAIVDCMLDGQPTNPVSVTALLRRKGELTAELQRLVYGLPRHAGTIPAAANSASTVLDLYRKRELHRVLVESDGLVLSAAGSYEEVAGEVSSLISDTVDKAVKPETLFTSLQVVDAALGHLFGERDVEPGIPMGIPDLDRLTGGMRPGQMIVIAGRSGHGKTTFGMQVARNVARNGVPVAVFSLEMPKEELGQRNAAAETGIAFDKIRDASVSSEELRTLAKYVDEQENRPLFVDDDPDQSVGEISLKVRKLIKDHGVKVVLVDYLQLVKPDGGPSGNSTQDVANVSDGLRRMARKLGVAVIALAQLNRGMANREDSRPRITDLRQSGEIEEDAHVVILVHLEFKVNPETERGKLADIIVAKNRGGITAEIEMLFDGAHSRFIDPAMVVGGGY